MLFLALFLFFFVSTTPFVDLTTASQLDPQASNSSMLNQAVEFLITAGLCVYGFRHPLGADGILQPRSVFIPLFIWFLAVSAVSADPVMAMRKVVLAGMICLDASIFLLLPRSEAQFSKLLILGTLITLAVAYGGVIALPSRAIHQATELVEPEQAGFWRGQFSHKNVAASVMVAISFVGLFAISKGFRCRGWAIVVLSVAFLMHTGGKSSSAYLPAILVLTWAFERWRWTRFPIAIVVPVAFNALAIGCALSPSVSDVVGSLGIDPTFTARTDIWRLALEAIGKHPILGYGFQGFWQTGDLFYSGGLGDSWAVKAFNGHNALLDLVLTTGLPSLVMGFLFLFVLPLRDIARADASGNDPALTRLFTRIWLYGLYSACLESIFFQSGNPLWFAFVVSVFGLGYQARSRVLETSSSPVFGRLAAPRV